MHEQRQGRFTFTVGEIERTFAISRATLIYYERLGLVTPRRDGENGYRRYSEDDVFELMRTGLLKGFGVAPGSIARQVTNLDDAFTLDAFDRYEQLADKRISYERAVRACIGQYRELCKAVGTVSLVDVEPYYIWWDRAENGYHDFPQDENLAILVNHAPLGGFGSSYTASLDVLRQLAVTGREYEAHEPDGRQLKPPARWGRTIAVHNAPLIDGLKVEDDHRNMAVIGGCRCAYTVFIEHEPYHHLEGGISHDTHVALDEIASFLDARGLAPDPLVPPFSPFSIPSRTGFHVPLCVPICVS